MMAHLSPGLREDLLRLVLAFAGHRGDEVADVCLECGIHQDLPDEKYFWRR